MKGRTQMIAQSKRYHSPICVLGVLLMASLSAISCKNKSELSETKTLDNFVGAISRQNKCLANPNRTYSPGDFPLAAKIKLLGESATEMDTPLLSLVRNAIVNIPQPIQNLFDYMDGHILVLDEASSTCKDLALELNPNVSKAKDLGEMSSCLVTIPPTKDHHRILHALFPPSIDEVHHNVMRVFGSFLTDVAPAARPESAKLIQSLMDEVAMSLLIDVAESPVLTFDKLSYFLSESDIAEIKKRAKQSQKFSPKTFFQGLSLESKESTSSQQLKKLAFIEAFDSFYCNDWAPPQTDLLNNILSKQASLSNLASIENTRSVMEKMFPRTFSKFSNGILPILQALGDQDTSANTSLTSTVESVGMGLTSDSMNQPSLALGESRPPTPISTASKYLAPAWAGTKAAFGSVWDNTGGALGRGYTSYANRVQKEINRNIDRGSGVIPALVNGVAGGAVNTYKEDVAAPIAARADRTFQNQMVGNGAGGINGALRRTLTVELLRPTGAPAIAESTVIGNRFDGSKYANRTERASEFFGGVSSLAGTTAAGVSMIPGLGNRVVGGGTSVSSPGVKPTGKQVFENMKRLKQIGTPADRAKNFGLAFEGNAKIVDIPAGTTLYRTGNGPGSWLTRTPIKDAVNSIALPASSETAARSVTKFVTTRPMQALEGGVSPQPKWATPGNPKLGGANQLYIPNTPTNGIYTGGLRRAADSSILGGAGAGAAGGSSLPKSSPSR